MSDSEFIEERCKLQKWIEGNGEIVNSMPLYSGSGPAPNHINRIMALMIGDKAMHEANIDTKE